jgi:broad specificity phosphatase PhoE
MVLKKIVAVFLRHFIPWFALFVLGIQQARNAGSQMKEWGITKILSSPLVRTVMTADIIAEQVGLGDKSVCVETGLVEEAKSFRGKTASEPRPNWNPLILPVSDLAKHSSRVDLDYKPLHIVEHVRDEAALNTVVEVHDTLTDRDAVTKDRCRQVLRKILADEGLANEVVLCVGHGATVKAMSAVLEEGLPDSEKVGGERTVSCFAQFRPVDPNNATGPWRSVQPEWGTGDFTHTAAEALEDQGFSGKNNV